MSYFSSLSQLAHEGIDFSDSGIPNDQPRGCVEPTHEYGEDPDVLPFEVGVARGDLVLIDEVEWPERIEQLERTNATLQHRVDKDWLNPLTQGRIGYCWYYSLIGAMQSCDARDGVPHVPLSGAAGAAEVKGGRDQGGWPSEAAKHASKHGVPPLSMWADCKCPGRSCKGPRGGCQARDISRIAEVRDTAALRKLGTYYEVPRGRDGWIATVSAILNLQAPALGWVGTGAWCDGHAMHTPRVIRTSRRGYELVPDNSWGKFKRRVPVSKPATGGVIVVNNNYDSSVLSRAA